MNLHDLLKIISGEKTGFTASVTRCFLGLLTPFYRTGVWFRNRKFDRDPNSVTQVAVPVVSVGNLTTGGTGKTPMVIWLSKLLRKNNVRVCVVSRGYGAKVVDGKTALNDEALELEHRLPDTPHLQDPDRVKIATIAIEELETEAIILDDGFQHRRIHRDLDIVLIDATNPFGFHRLIPRGLLREPICNLSRADLVIVTRCENAGAGQVKEIELQIKAVRPTLPFAKAKTAVQALIQFEGVSTDLQSVEKDGWFALCAIGNPPAFEMTLQQAGFQIVGSHHFPDHHNFSRDDFEMVAQKARAAGAKRIVCTHKDLVKICANRVGGIAIYALTIGIEFVEGQVLVEQEVLRLFIDPTTSTKINQLQS